jgi:hypothetical protein
VVIRNRYRFDRAFIANNPPSLPLIQLARFAVPDEISHQHSCVSIFRASMAPGNLFAALFRLGDFHLTDALDGVGEHLGILVPEFLKLGRVKIGDRRL